MRRIHALAIVLPALLLPALAACSDPAAPEEEAAATPQPVLTGNPAPVAVPSGKVLAPGEWSVREDANGVAAAFSEANGEPRLTLRCDRAMRQGVVEKPGALQPGEEYSIIAGGERFILPMQASTSALPTMSARVHPQQPILAAMAVTGTTFTLLGPGTTEAELPAAPGIRRVIDTCLTV